MRKIQKTISIAISLEHLPMSERELKQIYKDWEDQGFSFFRPIVVMDWNTEPKALGKAKLSVNVSIRLSFWQSLYHWIFPKLYTEKKLNKLTEILRDAILFRERKTEPNGFSFLWNQFWKTPLSIVWLNLSYTKLRMDLKLDENSISQSIPLVYTGEKKFYFRTGFLKTIHYRWIKKEFTFPYPKFAEVYVKTRDKHSDESIGRVFYTFLGYMLEKETDEYLLPYFGFRSVLPNKIRNQIPDDIWKVVHPQIQSEWKEENLFEKELEFRTVYQVSTSSQNHPK
ncbi:hypothetical protein EHQ23_11605 [Leptospira bourretii]|uniref:Uncharacterized protein n=1 Tax=Leptospira bourretii TaxID=2484962 RepID=A0A4R9INJ6_9LEPT|nr:hypothetical protein [Leptospira bourretii]TGK85301.1 hypothetical protein EHQ23_11605 [Leptospira bourretii]TGK91061.1 hypothetical protein EHQ26_13210 [Leptospira bourretii]TGL33332.1 hypothetical protein EHQ45_10315 [Leptospira bourretii]